MVLLVEAAARSSTATLACTETGEKAETPFGGGR